MKFTITEGERQRILNLYENNTTGPEESEFVANVNPYRNTEFRSAIRLYNPSLIDGDLFMKPLDIEENSECYKKIPTSNTIEQIKNQIKGKKFRDNDDVVTIENFTFQYLTYAISGSFGHRRRGILVKPQETPNELVIRWDIITDKNNYNTFSSIYKIPKSLEDFLKAQIPVLQLKDLPDCFFEIRRVKRQKTDFNP